MNVLLDAGALIALEASDTAMWRRVRRHAGTPIITHGGIIAQVWRGGAGRQARLAVALRSTDVLPLDDELGRRAGELLRRSGTSDSIDAALVALALDGDKIYTSDPLDIALLVEASGQAVDVIPV